MSKQNYSNHVRYHTLYHFVFLPLILLLTIGAAYCSFHYPQDHFVWIGISAAFAMIAFLGVMGRQHYALGNQDRIVRLEMRLRYYQLTGERLETYENVLSQGQIAALRFAADEELPGLLQRALADRLSPDDIKKNIKNWLPDDMRR